MRHTFVHRGTLRSSSSSKGKLPDDRRPHTSRAMRYCLEAVSKHFYIQDAITYMSRMQYCLCLHVLSAAIFILHLIDLLPQFDALRAPVAHVHRQFSSTSHKILFVDIQKSNLNAQHRAHTPRHRDVHSCTTAAKGAATSHLANGCRTSSTTRVPGQADGPRKPCQPMPVLPAIPLHRAPALAPDMHEVGRGTPCTPVQRLAHSSMPTPRSFVLAAASCIFVSMAEVRSSSSAFFSLTSASLSAVSAAMAACASASC